MRGRSGPDPFDRIEPYVRQPLVDDPHLQATVLFAEVTDLARGFDGSYETFCRQIRQSDLRPQCEACTGVKGRAHVNIEHPPAEKIQRDWVEFTETPSGRRTSVLVEALSHSTLFRGWFSESQDQSHLIVGMHQVLDRIGGTGRRWRADRKAKVINPATGSLQASFAPVAKHDGVGADPCPPRRGNRKEVVEKMIDYLIQSWWRTARVATPEQAPADLDRWVCRGRRPAPP